MEQQISWLLQMLHSFPARSGAGELSDLVSWMMMMMMMEMERWHDESMRQQEVRIETRNFCDAI